MLPYLFVVIPIALFAMGTPMRRVQWPVWLICFAMMVFFVGFRHRVGMDWNNYLVMIERASVGSLDDAFGTAEPLYALLLRASGEAGLGVYGANVVTAILLMLGLFRYARATPSPWIALLSSVPFVVVAVGMSANRQAGAIGVLLWAVAGWDRYTLLKRAAFIAAAASLHFSAVLFIVFLAADVRIPRLVKIFVVLVGSAVGLYVLDSAGRLDYYDTLYVSGQTEMTYSTGAFFHTMLNGAPAALYFLLGKRFRHVLLPNTVHRNMALFAMVLVPLSLVFSAAAGRVSMYLFPVSMYFYAAVPAILTGRASKFLYKAGVSGFFVFLLAFWLLASNTGPAYVPYRNYFDIYPAERQLCC